MSEPFMSEIKIMSFGFAPKGWALCNGQLLPINQNQALFSLLGTTYGGDGRVNFGLPNLQGKVPIHMGNGYTLGETAGEYAHTLLPAEMPQHNHQMIAKAASELATGNAIPGTTKAVAQAISSATGHPTLQNFGTGGLQAFDQRAIATAGGSQAHTNQQPFLVLNFCIALQGIFPSQN
jgi:microcystin-dependent protein